MNDESQTEINPMVIRTPNGWRQALAVALLGLIAGLGGGVGAPWVAPDLVEPAVRPDAYRGAEATRDNAKLQSQINELRILIGENRRAHTNEMTELYFELCSKTPPTPVKLRILATEGWINARDAGFRPGSLDWQETSCRR